MCLFYFSPVLLGCVGTGLFLVLLYKKEKIGIAVGLLKVLPEPREAHLDGPFPVLGIGEAVITFWKYL